jgi:leucine dehydrogenase
MTVNFSLSHTPQDIQLEEIEVEGYERIIKVTCPKAKLTAIISIHSTELGSPALGGLRIHPYPSFEQALEDVLRLSSGMTYKSAIAGVGLGGGKSVIIADPKRDKTPELLMAFGEAINLLEGVYVTAEDVGSTLEDMRWIRQKTPYVVGLPYSHSSGNPSPFTAYGIFRGIQATLQKRFGSSRIEGRKIAIQGLGSVGSLLAEHLFWEGAELIVGDLDPLKTKEAAKKWNAKEALPSEILGVECDLLAPCALGGILNKTTIPKLKCQAVAGAANNQLLADTDALLLMRQGILYAPDFVINGGGLINVALEIEEGGYRPQVARNKISKIYDTLSAIYEIAEKNHESTHSAALSLAKYRIQYGVGKRTDAAIYRQVVEV